MLSAKMLASVMKRTGTAFPAYQEPPIHSVLEASKLRKPTGKTVTIKLPASKIPFNSPKIR